MVSAFKNIYLPVHIATENNYFSMGLIFLLKELFEEEYQGGVIISKTSEPMAADLIVKFHTPGEKVFDWVGCHEFRTHNEYKFKIRGNGAGAGYLSAAGALWPGRDRHKESNGARWTARRGSGTGIHASRRAERQWR